MLFTIAVVLLVLWALGLVAVPAVGSLIHLVLVVALIVFLFGLLDRRRSRDWWDR